MSKVNPFTPNSPAPRGIFVGRYHELDEFDKALIRTKQSNPSHILLCGERGIGKTSLINVAAIFAKGDYEWGDEKHNFLTVRISLDENLCLVDFACNLKKLIEREIHKLNPEISFMNKTWEFLNKFEVAGIAYRKEESTRNNSQLIQEFVLSLVDTVKSLRNSNIKVNKEGLVILVDEADKASKDLNLGTFLKNLTETLSAEEQNYILLILGGLPNLRSVLRDSHESSLRLFQDVTILPLSKNDTAEVVSRGLEYVEKETQIKITLTEEAKDLIYRYSEGYPHFVQQIAHSAFEKDTDNILDPDDINEGFFGEHGALEAIGDRYYVKAYYKDINVESQREILNIMAEKWNSWVTRENIKAKFQSKITALDNGIRALIEKGIIIPRDGVKGQYRLQNASFAFWIENHNKNKYRS